ncbi:MAG: hypothetical protein RLO51_22270 [Thalassobaculum sp.]|uniref:hypothetical protein n=1 Tax=Thalassobaculum sp. TaxID=2022740 RepID=UPI0032EC7E93
MLSFLEHAAIGAVLIAVAAIGLARAAVYFRRTTSTGDRFFSTSMTSVLLVALTIGGAFYLGRAAFEADGIAGIAVAVAGLAYLVVVPTVAWRAFGPRPEALAVPVSA